jgi:serine/threonine protein kinase
MLNPETILQGRYRIVRQLGQGGMGAVYEAIDERLDTTVALKETLFADERLRKQFEREARMLARLHHPALPRVSDHFSEGDGQFLVMQYIAGEDLAEMVTRRRGPFPADQVLTWAAQLLDTLDYLHTQEPQIVHRDIKPQNLKLTPRGQIILLDFGLAKGQASRSFTGHYFCQHFRLHAELRSSRADPGIRN